MALVKFNSFASVSGSINGTTFARNKAGAYARNRTIPVNRNTVAQGIVRGNLSAATGAWKALTAAQRLAWNEYAAATPVVNKLGDSTYLSGQSWYVRVCAFQLGVDPSTVLSTVVAPDSPGVQTELPLTVDVFDNTNGLTLMIDTLYALTITHFAVQISGVQSPGVEYCNGPWRSVLGVNPPPVGPTAPVSFSWTKVQLDAAGIVLVPGERRFLRVRYGVDSKISSWFPQGPLTVATAP